MKDLILRYFDAFSNLYGIIPMKRAYRIIEKQNPELMDKLNQEYIEILNSQILLLISFGNWKSASI